MCALYLTVCVYTVKRRKCENKLKHSSVLMWHNIKHTQQEGSGESARTPTRGTRSLSLPHTYTVHAHMQSNVSVNQSALIIISHWNTNWDWSVHLNEKGNRLMEEKEGEQRAYCRAVGGVYWPERFEKRDCLKGTKVDSLWPVVMNR